MRWAIMRPNLHPSLVNGRFGDPALFVGRLHRRGALLFDLGVYLTVVGMVLMAFEAFGEEPAEVAECRWGGRKASP